MSYNRLILLQKSNSWAKNLKHLTYTMCFTSQRGEGLVMAISYNAPLPRATSMNMRSGIELSH